MKPVLHDIWIVLTLASIGGWLGLLLRMRIILKPLQRIWPELYGIFRVVFVAVVGTMIEMGCADVAAAFYPPILEPENIYLRLAGRAVEALTVIIACIVSMTTILGDKHGR